MLALDRVPRHLVVVGGSYVGLEFAQMYRRFGADVTVVEKSPRLISREDEDVSEGIREILEAEGIRSAPSAECIRLAPHRDGVAIGVNCVEGPPEAIGSHVLLAVDAGRTPTTSGWIGPALPSTSAATSRSTTAWRPTCPASGRSVIATAGARSRTRPTTISRSSPQTCSTARTGRSATRIPAYALYTDPPLGRVGMTDAEARESGRPLLTSKRPMTRVGRAVEKGETQGFMKVVADAETRKILGAAILGTGGDEAIHGVIDIMNADATLDVLRWAIPIHPTVSELFPTLLLDLKPAGSKAIS